MKKSILLSLFVSFLFTIGANHAAQADIYSGPQLAASSDQDPNGIDWVSIKTDHFNVIFPKDLEEEGRRVSGLLEVVYAPVAEGLKAPPRLIDVILRPHVLNSNGFVTLAPRRSEWFVTPWMGPEVGQTEWLHTLAVHEFRHVVQFDKSRAGFEKFLRVLFGETGTALVIGLNLPPWYLEGDAVGVETALSSGGRGRMPFFARDLRTLLLDGQKPSYDKLTMGSFENYIPNHYIVGYHLTTYLKRRFGKDILEKMHADTMERGYWPLSFYNSLKRFTGVEFDDAYADCLKELTALWRAQDALIQQIPATQMGIRGIDGWTNFSFPSRLSDGSMIAYRTGLAHIGQFVRLKQDKQAEVLWTPTTLLQDFPYKVRANKIAYGETSLNSRWGLQEYSKVVIKTVDGDTVYNSGPSQWLLPALDYSATRFAAVKWDYSGDPSIQIISIENGKVLTSIPWARNLAVMGLDWIPGSEKLIILHRQGTYDHVLTEIGLDGRRREIARSGKWNWAYPVATTTHVYFQSSASGIDNIHRISFADSLEERVTSERFGAYHPSLNENELVYSRYTAEGLRPVHLSLGGLKILPPGPDTFVPYYKPLVQQEGKGDILDNSALSSATVEPYSLTKNAWNPHSWRVLGSYFGSTLTPAIISTDVLNNLELMAGLGWNLNERTFQGVASARWSYLYPIFDFNAAFGSRREVDIPSSVYGKNQDKWEEGSTELGLTLPWRSVWRRWSSFGSLRMAAGLLHSRGRSYIGEGDLLNQTLSVPSIEGKFSFLQRQSQRDLMSPWGIQVIGMAKEGKDISGTNLPLSTQRFGAIRPFIPGFFKHNHLFGEISHEETERRGYHFTSPILFPRGWDSRFMEKRTKTSVNYAFPILYTDWSLSRYFYLRRLSMNLFYDNAWGNRYGRRVRFESSGTELWFDSNFLRNRFPIQWGIRYSHPSSKREDPSVELFLNLGVTAF